MPAAVQKVLDELTSRLDGIERDRKRGFFAKLFGLAIIRGPLEASRKPVQRHLALLRQGGYGCKGLPGPLWRPLGGHMTGVIAEIGYG